MKGRILILILLCACICCARPGQSTENGGTNDMAEAYPVRDVTDTFAWIGKTPEELGIDQSYRDLYSIRFTGDLFGRKVSGTAYMNTDFQSPNREMRVREISVYDQLEYREATEAALVARYGAAFREGIEPYVASNGGATYWSMYWTGEGVITVSNGQNNDWYAFSYAEAEMPEEIQKQIAGLTPKELMYKTGVLFEFKDGEVEDLRIHETEFEGKEAFRVSFVRNGVPVVIHIVKDGEALYDAYLNDGTAWEQGTLDQWVTCLRCVRSDGTGLIAEKNFDHDFWLIETNAQTTLEELGELDDFLLRRWFMKE